jgi:flagellin-like hook-associated protein FlgL
MADINLTKAVRSNLLSLQSTAAQMAKTQERLATGLKVNSALDNPSNFFTASALNSRASDMGNLLDSMSSGISTIQAADNGLKSITKTVESMQSTLRQARQDKSFKTESYTLPTTGLDADSEISFAGGAVGETAVEVELTKPTAGTNALTYDADATAWAAGDEIDFSINVDGGGAVALTIDQAAVQAAGNGDATIDSIDELQEIITAVIDAEGTYASGTDYTIDNDGTDITITSTSTGTDSSVAITGTDADPDAGDLNHSYGIADGAGTAGAAAGGDIKTVDELVSEINANTTLNSAIRASNDSGKLRIENLSTSDLTVTGVSGGAIDGLAGTDDIGGNTVRKNLVQQFNDLRDQLDKFADDASFNGINLLRGDKLTLTFNETGTSTIDIQAKDAEGEVTSINNTNLGITNAVDADFDSDTTLDARLNTLGDALGTLRSHSSAFGSNLSIVENRQDFTKNMINTLETGAANLTLADTNEEAANLLALQTRQQLSSTALSMASQADQAVLRLF